MSCQDDLNASKIENVPSESPIDDDQLQVDLRLGLYEAAAAEEEEIRRRPRRLPSKYELIQLASTIYDARRTRDRMFEGKQKLFGEPGWDMLLALYCLPSRGICLGVMSLGHAANVPPTTALGWQKKLEARGLIRRGPHVADSRQQLVGLTDEGRAFMTELLTRLYSAQWASQPAPVSWP